MSPIWRVSCGHTGWGAAILRNGLLPSRGSGEVDRGQKTIHTEPQEADRGQKTRQELREVDRRQKTRPEPQEVDRGQKTIHTEPQEVDRGQKTRQELQEVDRGQKTRQAFDCVDHSKLGNSERDGNTRPPDPPLEKPVCRSGSNS